jgi:hypothetical protein
VLVNATISEYQSNAEDDNSTWVLRRVSDDILPVAIPCRTPDAFRGYRILCELLLAVSGRKILGRSTLESPPPCDEQTAVKAVSRKPQSQHLTSAALYILYDRKPGSPLNCIDLIELKISYSQNSCSHMLPDRAMSEALDSTSCRRIHDCDKKTPKLRRARFPQSVRRMPFPRLVSTLVKPCNRCLRSCPSVHHQL